MASDLVLTPNEQRVAIAALLQNPKPYNQALRDRLIESLDLITDHAFVSMAQSVHNCAVCHSRRGCEVGIGKHVR